MSESPLAHRRTAKQRSDTRPAHAVEREREADAALQVVHEGERRYQRGVGLGRIGLGGPEVHICGNGAPAERQREVR